MGRNQISRWIDSVSKNNRTRNKWKQLTDTNGKFGRCPRTIGLTVTIGPSDQIETRRAIISHLFIYSNECLFFIWVTKTHFWEKKIVLPDNQRRGNHLRVVRWLCPAVHRKTELDKKKRQKTTNGQSSFDTRYGRLSGQEEIKKLRRPVSLHTL